jgi:hypothetical protein
MIIPASVVYLALAMSLPHYLIKGMIFGGEGGTNIVFWVFSTNLVGKFSDFKNNCARYHICAYVLM